MSSQALRIEPLGEQHDRAAFSCGIEPLDRYLATQAGQAVEKKLAAVFVLTDDGKTILGYYTLSSYVIHLDDIPDTLAKKLTKMRQVPATLLGRLARSLHTKGKGFGEILLADALKKALLNSGTVASWAVVVDAKDQTAAEFYKRYGFAELPTIAGRLFLPMNSIRELFERHSEPLASAAPEIRKMPPTFGFRSVLLD